MAATVSGIFIKTSKEERRKPIQEGMFLPNFGLEGDFHSKPGERQVCILTKEARDETEADTRDGLCYPRFQETVQVEGLDTGKLAIGDKLSLGEALFEITALQKRCWPECKIVQSGSICALKHSTLFCKVLRKGMIHVGEGIEYFSLRFE